MIALFALAIFKPPIVAYAIEKTGTEILQCDVINFDVDVEITKSNDFLMMVEVEISPGDLVFSVDQSKITNDHYTDSQNAISNYNKMYRTDYLSRFTISKITESEIDNYNNCIKQFESKEVFGVLPRCNSRLS